jgi:hypothetical protein
MEEAARHGCPLVLIRVVPRPETAEVRVPHGGPARWRQPWSPVETRAAVDSVLGYLREVVLRHGLAHDTELVAPVGDPFGQVEQEIARRSRPLVVLACERGIGSPVLSADEPMRRLLLTEKASVLRIQGPPEDATPGRLPADHHPMTEPGGAGAAWV